ncbi:MAG: hypothetical protein Rhims3KO_12540 [Hyphomicrobiales bacterium]
MSPTSKIIIVLVLAAVGAVLLFGLGNMIKGGSANRSQQLMRWRVILQAIAIVVVMAVVWFTSQS